MGGERLDTTKPTSKLMLTMLAAIAEFERGLMLERQREGIAKAKAEGKYQGRVPTARRQAATALAYVAVNRLHDGARAARDGASVRVQQFFVGQLGRDDKGLDADASKHDEDCRRAGVSYGSFERTAFAFGLLSVLAFGAGVCSARPL